MFGPRYFGDHHFGPRYFGGGGSGVALLPLIQHPGFVGVRMYGEIESGTAGYSITSTYDGIGQSFVTPAEVRPLTGISWGLSRTMTISGPIRSAIFAATGSPGSEVPTGSALVTSDDYDAASIVDGQINTKYHFFPLSGIELAPLTTYVGVVDASEVVVDVSNYMTVAFAGSIASRNASRRSSSVWGAENTDMQMVVYHEPGGTGSVRRRARQRRRWRR